MKKRHKHIRTCISWSLFLIYLVLLTYLLFFAEVMGRKHIQEDYAYNLVLFKEIGRFIRYYHKIGIRIVLLNLLGNVVAFMPFGYMLPILSNRAKHWYLTLLLSFTFSMLVETLQLIMRVGSFDVDDLLLNTLGGILGYIAYRIVTKKRNANNGN